MKGGRSKAIVWWGGPPLRTSCSIRDTPNRQAPPLLAPGPRRAAALGRVLFAQLDRLATLTKSGVADRRLHFGLPDFVQAAHAIRGTVVRPAASGDTGHRGRTVPGDRGAAFVPPPDSFAVAAVIGVRRRDADLHAGLALARATRDVPPHSFRELLRRGEGARRCGGCRARRRGLRGGNDGRGRHGNGFLGCWGGDGLRSVARGQEHSEPDHSGQSPSVHHTNILFDKTSGGEALSSRSLSWRPCRPRSPRR